MTAATITVYSTPTCWPCKQVKARLDEAGIAYESVDLTQDAAAVEELKSRLKTTVIHTPLIAFGNELLTIAGLPRIIKESLEVSSK